MGKTNKNQEENMKVSEEGSYVITTFLSNDWAQNPDLTFINVATISSCCNLGKLFQGRFII